LSDLSARPLQSAFERRALAALSAKRACAIGISFRHAQLQGARFDHADLRDANLRGVSFHGADLRHPFDDADMQPLPLVGGGGRVVDLTAAVYVETCFAKPAASE